MEKYRCITDDIVSNEVIITDERIAHIKAHHPGHFEIIAPFFQAVIAEPDYILADAPNTGLLLKLISEENLQIQAVLRLHTSSDQNGFKNSILSAWYIREKEFSRLLRNKKMLYKRE